MEELELRGIQPGAVYSTFGMARVLAADVGVGAMQARGSRKTPAPAGAPGRR